MIDGLQKTILLVDDDAIIALVEAKQLEKEGYRVIQCNDGGNAVSIACGNAEPVDLVLMDIDLGDAMDGTAVATEILRRRNIPIVFLSSHTEKEIVRKTENITSYGYVVKNSGITVLDASIKMAFKLFNANTSLMAKEKELRESEQKYRQLHEQAGLAICYFSLEGVVISYNAIALNYQNLRLEDVAGKSIYDLYPLEIADKYMDRFRKQACSDARGEYEDYAVLPGGEKWFITIMTRICDAGGIPIGVQVILREITEKKQAELKLDNTNRTLAILNEIITIANAVEDLPSLFSGILEGVLGLLDYDGGGIYIIDRDDRYAHMVHFLNLPDDFIEQVKTVSISDDRYYDLFHKGFPIISDHYDEISPEYIHCGFRSVVTVPLYSKKRIMGALNVVSRSRYVISEQEKNTLAAIGRELGTIIERITAEDESKKAIQNLKTLFNSIEEMVFILDMKGRILLINETVNRRLLYTRDELLGTDVVLLHDPGHREEARRIMDEVVSGTSSSFCIPLVQRGGNLVEVEIRITRGCWDDRQVIIAVARDITDRRLAEEALRESEIMFKTIVETSPMVMHVSEGFEQSAKYMNPKFFELFGYDSEEVGSIEDWWRKAYPDPGYRKSVSAEWQARISRAIGTGEPIAPMEVAVTCKDGKEKNIVWGFIPVNHKNFTYGFDVTERKLAEQRILNLLDEKKLMLEEIRHRVKNNMQTVLSLLKLGAELHDNIYAKSILSDSAERVQSMMLLYDGLQRPENVSMVSIGEYLPFFINTIVAASPRGDLVQVRTSIEDIVLDTDVLAQLGIIINELITNSIRYGFAERDDGVIAVTAFTKGKRVCIIFEDNGRDMPGFISFEKPEGFGMHLVGMLVKRINGYATIERSPGTKITIEFDKSVNQN